MAQEMAQQTRRAVLSAPVDLNEPPQMVQIPLTKYADLLHDRQLLHDLLIAFKAHQ